MGKIIVTIKDDASGSIIDAEIPTTQPMETLKYDIVEAVNGANAGFYLDPNSVDLYCQRMNRVFFPGDTCESVGLWNGDILSFRPRAY